MIIEATRKPFRYRWSGGEIRFFPGEPVHVETKLGQRILKKCEGKVRQADGSSFHIGQRVRYRLPVHITDPKRHTWEEHVGLVKMIDQDQHLVLIIPEDETIPWRWMNLSLIQGGSAK